MRRVLFLAYFFPPLGGAGVQRSAKFARYLPEFGWEPVVVTARNRSYWLVDESLLTEIPADMTVSRTPSPDGPWLYTACRPGTNGNGTRHGLKTSRLRRVASFALLPDVYRPWKPFALREARRLLRELRVDAILTTSSPDTAHLIGLDLKRESGLPWVADFRDPWTQRIAFDPPTRWHRRWHERREAEVVDHADRIIVTSDETGEDFARRYPHLPRNRTHVIPNGFDPADFPATKSPGPDWSRFRIVYVGQLAAGRTVAPFLPVLERFLRERPRARAVTDVRFVGPREIENDALVATAGFEDVVTFTEPRPHGEATEELRRSHVCLLVENMGERAGLIAQGKLYECLYSARPILAVVPDGAVTRLLNETGGGVGVDGSSVGRGAEFLVSAFDAWERREILSAAAPESLHQFERRSLARELADVLSGVSVG